jgi:hypothetical protein
MVVRSQPRQIVHETPISKTPTTKKALVEWLKVKAVSSIPSTEKKRQLLRLKSHSLLPPKCVTLCASVSSSVKGDDMSWGVQRRAPGGTAPISVRVRVTVTSGSTGAKIQAKSGLC